MSAILLPDPVALAVTATGLLYVEADRRVRSRGGSRSPWAPRAFLLGLAIVLVSLTGPLDAAVDRSFSLHMVQHLLLTMVAAPLLVIGAPLTLALRAWPGAPRRVLARILHTTPIRIAANPLVAWSVFFTVLWGAHLTGWFEAALRSDVAHAGEHAAFLASAMLFWMPVVHADPIARPLSYPARILYLFAAMPAMAFLGLTIASATRVLYPTYAQAEGLTPALADQAAAGAIMWAGTMIMIVPALGAVLLDWMRADEREAARIDERLLRESMEGAR
jgi:putative membrane protein